jgi:hypothetical protein
MTTTDIRPADPQRHQTGLKALLATFNVFVGFAILGVLGGLLWLWLGSRPLAGTTGSIVAVFAWPALGLLAILASVAFEQIGGARVHVSIRGAGITTLLAATIVAGVVSAIAYLIYRVVWTN